MAGLFLSSDGAGSDAALSKLAFDVFEHEQLFCCEAASPYYQSLCLSAWRIPGGNG
jgi:hypothetical protein